MKTSVIVLALSLGFGSVYAQKIKEAEVPAAVKESFAKKYAGAKVEKWEKEGTEYEAEFDMDKIETSASFDANGNFLQSEVEIKVADLPKAVSDYVTKNLAGKKIKEASKITDAKGTVMYEAEVDEADYMFDSNGAFLKKEVETEKDDDDKKKK
jgi:hypothetical protein